jgi:flagellar hook-associated protein 3 FlgL
MRVTFNMLSRGVLSDITSSSQRLMEAQRQASSGKRISKPSDDVSGTGRALNLRSSISDIDQFLQNSDVVKSQLEVTTSAMDTIVSSLQRVNTITVQATNSTVSDDARKALVTELDELSSSIASAAATQYGGKYVFSGSMTSQQPLVPTGITSPPYTYAGNDTQIKIQITPWTSVASNVTANAVLNMDGNTIATTSDVFSTIRTLRDAIQNGDLSAVKDQLDDVKAHLGNVTTIRSEIGARIASLDTASNSLTDTRLTLSGLLSKTEDVDTAQAIVDLQTRQNMYEAAISTASKILSLSLADYFK